MSQLQVTGEAKIRDIQGPVVANSGVITALDGAANQYVRGDGTLAIFPTSSGGGSSVSYYLNGSVNQGTFGGSTYYQMSRNAIVGTGTNFSTSSDGLIAQFITDANDPDVVSIPSGNWNVEFFMNVSASSGALASFYVEIYKYNGSTFTLLATNVATPEQLTNTTTVDAYFTSVAMPLSAMAVTDRLAVRVFANVASKTVTLYTEDNRLCQIVTTFSNGLTSLNNLTDQSQYLTTGTSGTDFNIVSSGDTHTFNIPSASATNRGLVTIGSQSFEGIKTFNDAIKGEEGVLLKNGVISSSNGYTALNAFENTLIITSLISGTPYSNSLEFTPSTSNTYTFPNATGTLALTSNLSSYVPYTGATASVNLGGNSLSASALTVATNLILNSTFLLKKAGLGVTTPTYVSQFAATTGVGIGYSDGTGGGNFIFPTASINDYTYPAITGTLALLEGTQTFSGSKTFSLDIFVNGLTVGRGAGSVSTNTVLGLASFATNTTGTYNVAIGQSALNSNTTGGYNTAVGGSAMVANTTGSFNTAIGSLSLNYNTIGTNNTALGYSSLYTNTTGSQNTALGAASLYNNTTGSNNTAIGNVALQQNTTGTNNTAIGSFSSYVNTTGQNNTSVGASTLIANTTGSQNTALGTASLQSNTTGESNVAVGVSSLGVNTIGQYNVAVGRSASNANTTGNYNTALGSQALANITTGSQNIAIGYNSGSGITTGSQNTIIGTVTGLSSTLSNNIILADGAGNIRYQWNGTNNVFGNPISGTSATFSLGISAVGGISFPETVGGSNYGGITGSSSFLQIAAQNGSAILFKSSNNTNAITISTVGKVDFGSTIGNGTYTYTLPSATGTLALTSDLSAYLPLTGGTLTGALSGTSATFASTINVQPSTGTNQAIAGYLNDGGQLYVGIDNSTGSGFGKGNYAYNIYGNANRAMVFSTDGTTRLTIAASTGAATFSSSVQVGSASTSTAGLLVIGGSSIGTASSASGQILIGLTPSYRGSIAYDDNAGYLYIDNTYNNNSGNIYFRTKTGGTAINALTIAGTGAATFSSTLDTAGNITSTVGATNTSLKLIRTGNTFECVVQDNQSRIRTFGASGNDKDLLFDTDNAGTTRLFIKASNGNVGIGTTSPTDSIGYGRALDIQSATGAALYLRDSDAPTTQYGFIAYDGNDNGLKINNENSSGFIRFNTAATERMRITSGGAVAINTTNTTYAQLNIKQANGNLYGGAAFYSNNGTESFLGIGNTGSVCGLFATYGASGAYLPITFSTGGNESMRITSGGNVLIGTSTDAGYKLDVNGTGRFSGTITTNGEYRVDPASGDGILRIYTAGTERAAVRANATKFYIEVGTFGERLSINNSSGAATFSSLAGTGSRAVLADSSGTLSAPVSDISVKENIKPIAYGLSEILKMNPVWFDFIDEYKNYGEGRQNGMIAQEIADVIPEAVFVTPSTGKMGINYDQMHAVYIKAIQQLEERIKQLENK